MVKILFAPAHWVLARLNFVAAFVMVSALFLLPTGIALFAQDLLPRPQLLALVAALCALAVYGLIALREFVSTGIARIIRITDRIAGGELLSAGVAVPKRGTRDSSRLWNSIIQMNGTMADIVLQVRASAEAIAAGARTIADGNAQLAQRTEEQAASLEETASGIEQLAASAQRNAEGCAQANELAGASREVASQAAERMQQVAATMRSIEDSARRVAEILGTVEGIAFQTNILALNAAVEAARAGDQGRGFAVVATEVRSLAQRSAAAAREIHGLIGESIASVERGRELVDAAEETMGRVLGSVEQVTQVLGGIALATREQNSGVQEINKAIAQVDAVTQQNAALVEEAAGAAESFEREARQLVEVVGRFKTDRSEQRGEAVALVQAAVEHVRRHGLQRALADFNDRRGGFVRGELFLVALDPKCTVLALGSSPDQVGRNDWNQQDADGRFFSRMLVQLALKQGSGWCDYRPVNPATGRVEEKSAYFQRVGDTVLICGIYRKAGPVAAPVAKPAAVPGAAWPRLGRA
ncbi:cache domain-containing protein [Ramlibacter sp. USB13]|uniref:Cache domain-containing protein n=1 Tax=Ramlibacter cellulosilyticus TaxID=2764187 RepID=A0A923MQN5_9BURK|nr:methyl-accepting chemotaxis protein [Ramlibacter cellulosilyticus]MBC5783063.1 cache domain-containing protein [Ramlibacter cellulosilyticus]